MTLVRRLTDDDRSRLEDFLWMHADTSLFMLGNLELSGLTHENKPYHGIYVGAFDGDALTGLIVRYWNGNCMPQGQLEAVMAIWHADDLFRGPINGFVGRNDLCLALRDEFLKHRGQQESDLTLNSQEVLYRLSLSELNIPESAQRLSLQIATEAHMNFLLPWMIEYNVEALNAQRSQDLAEHCHDSLRQRIALGNCFVLFEDSEPLATTGFNARVKTHVQVGGVYTPMEKRRQGHAQCAVAQSLALARAEGYQHSVLFTDEHNLSARRAYERIGYQRAGTFGLYLINV